MTHRRSTILGLALLHGAWTVALSFGLLQYGWARADEVRLVRLAALVQPLVPFADVPPAPEAKPFLFVNVAHALRLVERTDSLGIPDGNQAVVDRGRLAAFLERLDRLEHPQAGVVFDIAFVDPTPDDSAFARSLRRTPVVLAAQELDAHRRPVPVTFRVPTGVTVFSRQSQTVLKYTRVWNDSLLSLPARMAEQIHPGLHASRARWDVAHPLRLNTYLLAYRMCPPENARCVAANVEAGPGERVSSFLDLHTLEAFPDAVLASFVEDRIVLLGDFVDRDLHLTSVGMVPGPLILANAYLGLVAGDHLVPLSLLILLGLGFTAISYGVFADWRPTMPTLYHKRRALRWGSTVPGGRWMARRLVWARIRLALLWIPLSLLALSLIAGLYYGLYLQVLALTVYFLLLSNLRPKRRRVRARLRRLTGS